MDMGISCDGIQGTLSIQDETIKVTAGDKILVECKKDDLLSVSVFGQERLSIVYNSNPRRSIMLKILQMPAIRAKEMLL